MSFDVISEISRKELIAVGHGIREIRRLRRVCGIGRWKKLKGVATI